MDRNLFLCPITQELYDDPVMTCDGQTYSRVAIENWFQKHKTSPVTNLELDNLTLTPNFAITALLNQFFPEETNRNKSMSIEITRKCTNEVFVICVIKNTPTSFKTSDLRNSVLKLECCKGFKACDVLILNESNMDINHFEFNEVLKYVFFILPIDNFIRVATLDKLFIYTNEEFVSNTNELLSKINLDQQTNYKYLHESEIKSGEIVIPLRNEPIMQIFIKGLWGNTIVLDVNIEDTVKEIKLRIFVKMGIPVDQQRLLFAAMQLEDDRLLKEYPICQDITMHLVLRMRGGCIVSRYAAEFNYESKTTGADYLLGMNNQTLSIDIVNTLQSNGTEKPIVIDNVLSDTECKSIQNLFLSDTSHKLKISFSEFSHADIEKWMKLSNFDQIWIRRVVIETEEKFVRFHTDDASFRTMQITLNKDYTGGDLVFALNDEFFIPTRNIGTATIHNAHTAHGVTSCKGRRDSLFFVDTLGIFYLHDQVFKDMEKFKRWVHFAKDKNIMKKYPIGFEFPSIIDDREREDMREFLRYVQNIRGFEPTFEDVSKILDFIIKITKTDSFTIYQAIIDYAEFLKSGSGEPSLMIDLIWHTHMQFERYESDCIALTGHYVVHHF
jgi:hypothetical protein